MGALSEIVIAPLTAAELGVRYRALCEDPRFANLPGKIEIDRWGKLLIGPADNEHGLLQARLAQCFAALGGRTVSEASVATEAGLLVADVAWLSDARAAALGIETPFPRAPELCVEIVSPSNSRRQLDEKIAAYLAAGAVEVWIVFPKARAIEFHGTQGTLADSAYAVALDSLFAR